MDTKGRPVVGSHNRHEFVLINPDEIGKGAQEWMLMKMSLTIWRMNLIIMASTREIHRNSDMDAAAVNSEIPLLTYGQEDSNPILNQSSRCGLLPQLFVGALVLLAQESLQSPQMLNWKVTC
ncbi:hypothetical protein ACS0TY_016226 [Phlomoides rotata]